MSHTAPHATHGVTAEPLSRSPAIAARIRQLTAQAEHRRAIADFHARHLADQQSRTTALLTEMIAALASLLNEQPPPPQTRSHGQTGQP
jgi:hypothetical protein